MKLPQESFKLLTDVLHSTSVEQYKVENFCAFADIFLPLSKSAACGLCLCAEVLEKTQKAPVFDICCLSLDESFDLLQVVIDFMWLLHVVFV